jgi:multiple sugar transport system permease protein
MPWPSSLPRARWALLRFAVGAQMFPFFIFLIPWFFILRYFAARGRQRLDAAGGVGSSAPMPR